MAAIRHHLRAFVLVWLTCQAAVLSAFVPTGCCPQRSAEAGASDDCHGADGLCPMHQTMDHTAHSAGDVADVQPDCPMHAAQSAPPVPCVMRGLCGGPSAALSILLPAFAVPEQPLDLEHAVRIEQHVSITPSILTVSLQNDTPPPRG